VLSADPGLAPAIEEILDTISAFISLKGNCDLDAPLCGGVEEAGLVDGGGDGSAAFGMDLIVFVGFVGGGGVDFGCEDEVVKGLV